MRCLWLVVVCVLATGCNIYGCSMPGDTTSEYVGMLGHATAPADATEDQAGVVTITLNESDGPGTLDGATITVALRGLRDFGDRLHVHDRARFGEMVLSSDYGYYRSDSLVFRSHSYRDSGGRRWDAFKRSADGGRGYFELHSRAGIDTAGLRLVRRSHQDGACT